MLILYLIFYSLVIRKICFISAKVSHNLIAFEKKNTEKCKKLCLIVIKDVLEDKASLILIMLMRPREENANKVLIYTHIWLILSWPYHCTAVARDLLIDSLQNMIIFRKVVTETHNRIIKGQICFFLSSFYFCPFFQSKTALIIKVFNCEFLAYPKDQAVCEFTR